ncbi:hypothetical protein [Actinomadura luteofluorescens]|uniref:hypothetical protein n=1 Tax=Actinomadura luteofluorescens TaxID=46163 RepID=UPI003D919E45
MSGRHRVQRPRRVRVAMVLVPVRLVWRGTRTAWTPVAGAWARLVAWAEARFDRRDESADVPLASPQETTSDPVPALAAPVEEPAAPAVQEPLTPEDAFEELHAQHPTLPRTKIYWSFWDGAVTGKVDALAADEAGQRAIVAEYAAVFAGEVGESPDGPRLSVFTSGDFANVRFVIAAILIHDDTMPLPAYREAVGTLETQEISDEVLTAVGAR